eukprot:scaffold275104_cov24-Tisochrysis_lutea.AAC.1
MIHPSLQPSHTKLTARLAAFALCTTKADVAASTCSSVQDQQLYASSAAMPASVGPPLKLSEATMDVPEIDVASAEAVAWNKVDVGPLLPLPLESSVYVDSVSAVLQHTRR